MRPFAIIKEQNERLLELKESAQKASEAKSHFLANMSHEMRTPLNAIIGFSESMVNSRASREEAKKNLEKIHISGMILLGIVNDILDLSKVESGKFALLPVEYNLASLINDTISLTIVRKGEKNIRFHWTKSCRAGCSATNSESSKFATISSATPSSTPTKGGWI